MGQHWRVTCLLSVKHELVPWNSSEIWSETEKQPHMGPEVSLLTKQPSLSKEELTGLQQHHSRTKEATKETKCGAGE